MHWFAAGEAKLRPLHALLRFRLPAGNSSLLQRGPLVLGPDASPEGRGRAIYRPQAHVRLALFAQASIPSNSGPRWLADLVIANIRWDSQSFESILLCDRLNSTHGLQIRSCCIIGSSPASSEMALLTTMIVSQFAKCVWRQNRCLKEFQSGINFCVADESGHANKPLLNAKRHKKRTTIHS